MAASLLLTAAGLSVALWPAPGVLVDYPNHLARAHILAHLSDPPLAEHYAIDAQPLIPYLGLDAVLVPLVRLVGTPVAGALGVTIAFVALTGATLLLDRALNGRVRWTSALMLPALFNALLSWGNVNYLLGVAGVLALFAGWIASEAWPAPRRWAVFAVASTLLFLSHVLAAGVWALLVAGYELGRLVRERRADGLWPGALQFVPAGVLWLAVPHSMRVFETSTTQWGGLAEHLLALASPFSFDVWLGGFASPTAWVDWLTSFAMFGGLILAAAHGRVSIDRRLWAPLLLGLAFTLAVPVFVQGIWANHLRLPTPMACLLAAGLTLRPPAPRLAALLVTILLIGRLATIVPQMTACAGYVDDLRAAFARLPVGAHLLPVLTEDRGMPACKPWRSFAHVAALAVVERQAFVPTLFWENTLLDLRDPARKAGGDLRAISPERLRREGWQGFDHVLWLHFGVDEEVPDRLEPLIEGPGFTVYRADASPAPPPDRR